MGKSKAHVIYRNDEGKIVPGASTISKLGDNPAGLIKAANKLGLAGVDSSKLWASMGEIGTLAHKMILDHFKNEETDTKDYTANEIDKAENSLLSFYEWEKQHKLEPIFLEEIIVCKTYGGTLDYFGGIDGINELIDFKTGSGIWPSHWYQCAGYYNLLTLIKKENVERVRILNIPRTEDESFMEEIKDIPTIEKYLAGFLKLVDFYHLDKRIK